MEQYIPKSALVAEIERRIKTNKECMLGLRNLDYYQGKVDALNDTISSLNTLDVKEVDIEEVPIILTEEILKINGFKLYAPPRYKEAFWSKIYKDKEGNGYVFNIYMEQRAEHLLTITPLATPDGKGHPDCHLPHPQTVQQLQNSLRLFGIEDIIRV